MSNDKRVRNPITNPEVFVVADGTSAEANLGYSNVEQVKSRLNISSIEIKDINSAQYTLLLSDNGKTLQITNTSPTTITLPNNFPVGYNVRITSLTTSSVTFSATGGAQLIGLNTLQGAGTFYVSQIQNNNSVYRQISSGQSLITSSASSDPSLVDSNYGIEVISAVAIKIDGEKYRVIVFFRRQNPIGREFIDFQILIGATKASKISHSSLVFNSQQTDAYAELDVFVGRMTGDKFIQVRSSNNQFNIFSDTISDNNKNVLYTTPSLIRQIEADAGSVSYTFTINRVGKEDGQTNVNWSVVPANIEGVNNVTASAFTGNALPSGSVSFIATETEKQITINVLGNTTIDGNRAFSIQLSNPSVNDVIVNLLPVGLIIDNDISYSEISAPPIFSSTLFGTATPNDWIYDLHFFNFTRTPFGTTTPITNTYCIVASMSMQWVSTNVPMNVPIKVTVCNITPTVPEILGQKLSTSMTTIVGNKVANIQLIDNTTRSNSQIMISLFYSTAIVSLVFDVYSNAVVFSDSEDIFFLNQVLPIGRETVLGDSRVSYLPATIQQRRVVKTSNEKIVTGHLDYIYFGLTYTRTQKRYNSFSVVGTICYAFESIEGSPVDLINIDTNTIIGSITNPSQMAYPIAEISSNLLLCLASTQLRLIRINNDFSINVEAFYTLITGGWELTEYNSNHVFQVPRSGKSIYVIKIVEINNTRAFQIIQKINLAAEVSEVYKTKIFQNFLYLVTNAGIQRIDISSYT